MDRHCDITHLAVSLMKHRLHDTFGYDLSPYDVIGDPKVLAGAQALAQENRYHFAWWALWLPEKGRWAEKHRAEKYQVLKMEFRTFANHLMKIPCQIIRTGGRLVYRLLNWNPWLPVFRRLSVELDC